MKWDDQETAWNVHLGALAKEVNIPLDLIWSSRQQLITIFGKQWLELEYNNLGKFNPAKDRGIIGVITNPIVNNAVEVVELAKYLNSIRKQENFNTIVIKLKNSADYEAIRLNLAVGYRLKRVGWKDIIVEPSLGDVEGTYHGQKYIVECAMLNPPRNVDSYVNNLFNSFYKFLKLNKYKTWLHIEFLSNPLAINQNDVIRDIKSANYKYAPKGLATCIEAQDYVVRIQTLDERASVFLHQDKSKGKDSYVDIGYQMNRQVPEVQGDIYSLDLKDSSKKQESGYITFGGIHKNVITKSTAEQLKIKIKNKKEQTKSRSSDVRRIFVFQPKNIPDDESIELLGRAVSESVKPEDDVDDVIILDRRHQKSFNKLRFPSSQLHIINSTMRLPHIEKMVNDMKEFEYSEWLID